ncbi:MAG: S16 family serine protease, partial [Thermoanaerobaculia bacterium]|nr:S16 family serine protease [Thermoanaerobaculia bacterium]
DGPSAGIGICTSMVSALTGIPVRADVAMTGEITLRGDILPIGGLKEKLLAAREAGIKTVVVPRLNERDMVEIPPQLTRGLTFHFVDHMNDVLDLALKGPRGQRRSAAAAI